MKRLCTAHRTDGRLCRAPAIKGGTVCRVHGGSAPQVREAARRRIEDLVDPALVRLRGLLENSADDRTVLAAVKEVLNRAGIDPPLPKFRITVDEAEEVLTDEIRRLEELFAEEEALPSAHDPNEL